MQTDSAFGVVHARPDDRYLPIWIKTLTWNTTGSQWWRHEINQRRTAGKRELPILSARGWDSDDTHRLDTSWLAAFSKRVTAYFSAAPGITHWEAGIEENLSEQYRKPFYWPNLYRELRGHPVGRGRPQNLCR